MHRKWVRRGRGGGLGGILRNLIDWIWGLGSYLGEGIRYVLKCDGSVVNGGLNLNMILIKS